MSKRKDVRGKDVRKRDAGEFAADVEAVLMSDGEERRRLLGPLRRMNADDDEGWAPHVAEALRARCTW